MTKNGFTLINFLRKTIKACPMGFTLIELLVALSIIAVLSTIALLTFREVMQGARDGKRQTDLKQIQSAAEQYRADAGFYPTRQASGICANGRLQIGCPLKNLAGDKTYLNLVPKDPKGISEYYYDAKPGSPTACDNTTPSTRCSTYCLYATLEKIPSTAQQTAQFTTDCPSPMLSNYNYLVTPP